MKTMGLCHICGRPATNTCQMCGKQVCDKHYDSKLGMCLSCKMGRRAGE